MTLPWNLDGIGTDELMDMQQIASDEGDRLEQEIPKARKRDSQEKFTAVLRQYEQSINLWWAIERILKSREAKRPGNQHYYPQ